MIGKFSLRAVPMCSRRISPGWAGLLIRTVAIPESPTVSRFSKDFEGLIELLAGVLAGHDGADAGLPSGPSEGDAGAEDARFEEGAREIHGLAAVADDDGRDRGFARRGIDAADVEAQTAGSDLK